MRFLNSYVIKTLILFTLFASQASAATVYNVQAGLLVSIQNIDINGTAYDVTFRDGVFENLFDINQPFTFTSASQASDASQALSIIMNDNISGNFDSDPLLTSGCAADNCQIRTPYLFDFGFVSAEWFRNAALEVDDERGSLDFLPSYDSTGSAVVFAEWSHSTIVPLPPALLLFSFGLASLIIFRKKHLKN